MKLRLIICAQYADFIDRGADLPDEDVGQRAHHRPTIFIQDENEDVKDLERRIQEKYQRPIYTEYGEDVTDVDQQVVDVDNVRQKVTVKLIPIVDLQMIANKLVRILVIGSR
ncbi:hypothetical protein J5N97_003683 [Dioscorea zingiberensis]|uniref:Spt5 KOW domain-containing protein n=1 Tax=Dioscorea zingiberensis TaxID=325984 RepID=A0A9D5D6F7_9LILI|nr:hypothetical protein J5N97_003683 [Dioscorea zingiberensis]